MSYASTERCGYQDGDCAEHGLDRVIAQGWGCPNYNHPDYNRSERACKSHNKTVYVRWILKPAGMPVLRVLLAT